MPSSTPQRHGAQAYMQAKHTHTQKKPQISYTKIPHRKVTFRCEDTGTYCSKGKQTSV